VHQPAAGVDTTHAWEPAEALRKAEARALAAQNDLQREREQARELFARLHAAEERAGAQARRLAELGGVEQGLSEALSRARLLEGRLAAAEAELARSQAQAAAADEARAAAAAGARAAAAAAAAARRADLAAAQRAVAAERRGALLRDELQAERDAARRTRAKAELLERQLGQASEGQQHQQQQQQQQQQRRDLEVDVGTAGTILRGSFPADAPISLQRDRAELQLQAGDARQQAARGMVPGALRKHSSPPMHTRKRCEASDSCRFGQRDAGAAGSCCSSERGGMVWRAGICGPPCRALTRPVVLDPQQTGCSGQSDAGDGSASTGPLVSPAMGGEGQLSSVADLVDCARELLCSLRELGDEGDILCPPTV
jgi:hypothetical protein